MPIETQEVQGTIAALISQAEMLTDAAAGLRSGLGALAAEVETKREKLGALRISTKRTVLAAEAKRDKAIADADSFWSKRPDELREKLSDLRSRQRRAMLELSA